MNNRFKDLVFDVKMLNLCAWATVIISYITPYRISEDGMNLYGYPFPFIQIHPLSESRIPFLNGSIDLLMMFIDLYIIYIIIKLLNRLFNYIKKN